MTVHTEFPIVQASDDPDSLFQARQGRLHLRAQICVAERAFLDQSRYKLAGS